MSRVRCSARRPDFDFGSSPILVDLPSGRSALIAGQKSGVVHAVDPDNGGAILWQTRVGKGTALGGVQWGSAFDGSRVYIALSDVHPEPAPAGTPGAQPSFVGQALRLYPQAGGGLFAIDPSTGQTIWTKPHPGYGDKPGCSPAQSAAVTAIPGVVFSGGLDGHFARTRATMATSSWTSTPRRSTTPSRAFLRMEIARWTRAGRSRRHGVRQFRLCVRRRHAGQCLAGVSVDGS